MYTQHPIEIKAPARVTISKFIAISFSICVCMLVLANILLISQNRELKEAVKSLHKASEIQTGASLPPLKGMDEIGNQVSFEYGKDDKPTLLLIFSPTCGVCKDNMKFWQSIIGDNKDRVRIVGVTLTSLGLKEFINQYAMSTIKVIEVDAESGLNYKLKYTPQTVLIDRNGRVEMVWTGLLNKKTLEEIRSKLTN